MTESGRVVHFRVPDRVRPGEKIELSVAADRVLVFGADDAPEAVA
ncbi:hypothetical protein [Sphaerisporangium album]|nr:hypothetical protein [Sphaerisporangium album]